MQIKRPYLQPMAVVLALLFCAHAGSTEAAFTSTFDEIGYLGLLEADFVPLVANIKRIARPIRGPRGEWGKWNSAAEPYLGQSFENTYFVENGKVSRIEKSWATSAPACENGRWFEQTLEQLNDLHGPSQVSGSDMHASFGQRSAVWTVQEAQVSLFADLRPGKCAMRLVLKPNLVKDGAEL